MAGPLATYLHDHLGGANLAIALLEDWIRAPSLAGLAQWAKPLRDDIETDRETLRQVIARVGESPHTFKEKLGWLGEKLSRPKLAGSDAPELGVFEGLEILALGILGKQSLWETLEILAPTNPCLADFDYPNLLARARQQHATVASRRRDLTPAAFAKSR